MAKRPGIRRKTGHRTKTTWTEGKSGNLLGRPKLSPEQKEARAQAQAVLDAHTVDAAWAVVDMLSDVDPKVRIAAVNSLLDRTGLKGVSRVELTGANAGPVRLESVRQQLVERLDKLFAAVPAKK